MPMSLIQSNPKVKRPKPNGTILNVAEFFINTCQGEGISSGCPAAFLRLQYCVLQCVFCDTLSVWKDGNPYSTHELLDMIEKSGVHERMRRGGIHRQHLILTGGSPLKQQAGLLCFLQDFQERFQFRPYVEVENEMVLFPIADFSNLVSQWNNSPKLANSGMPKSARYKPDVIKFMAGHPNSWVKFVVTGEADWDEIVQDFIEPGLIRRDQIILMPEGSTREQLQKRYQTVVDICTRESVRFSDRLQVTIFNETVGV